MINNHMSYIINQPHEIHDHAVCKLIQFLAIRFKEYHHQKTKSWFIFAPSTLKWWTQDIKSRPLGTCGDSFEWNCYLLPSIWEETASRAVIYLFVLLPKYPSRYTEALIRHDTSCLDSLTAQPVTVICDSKSPWHTAGTLHWCWRTSACTTSRVRNPGSYRTTHMNSVLFF